MDVSGIVGPLLSALLLPLAGASFIFGLNGLGFVLMFLGSAVEAGTNAVKSSTGKAFVHRPGVFLVVAALAALTPTRANDQAGKGCSA